MKDPSQVTPFRQKVFDAARQIPKGRVTTYKLLAESIKCGSPRAIGQALKHNPFAPQVPCHRVIRSDLTIGGFSGHTNGPEISRKKNLLRKEGVEFKKGTLIDPNRIYRYDFR